MLHSWGLPASGPVMALMLGTSPSRDIQPGPEVIDPAAGSCLGTDRQHVDGSAPDVVGDQLPMSGLWVIEMLTVAPLRMLFPHMDFSRSRYSVNSSALRIYLTAAFGVGRLRVQHARLSAAPCARFLARADEGGAYPAARQVMSKGDPSSSSPTDPAGSSSCASAPSGSHGAPACASGAGRFTN